MRARKHPATIGLALLAAVCAPACTLVTDIGVCDAPGPAPEVDVNPMHVGIEGAGPQAVIELPARGALAFFTTTSPVDGEATSFVRASVIDANGARARACERPPAIDLPYAQVSGAFFFGELAAAPPAVASITSYGLLAMVRFFVDVSDTSIFSSRLVAAVFTGDGCRVDGLVTGDLQLGIGDEGVGQHVVGQPSVVRIGDNRFVVAWVSGDVTATSVRTRAKARVIELRQTAPPVLGPIVEIDHGWITAMAMTQVGPGRLAFAWQRLVLPDAVTFLEIWSDELERVPGLERQPLASLESATMLAVTPRIALGFDGGQLLAAWNSRKPGEPTRVSARFRGPSGEPFVSVDSLDGLPFSPSEGVAGAEANPVIAPVSGGGFLLAWEEHGLSIAGSPTDRVSATAFDALGRRRFLNGACDVAPIALSTRSDRSLYEPGLTRIGDDAIVATWSARDRDGPDAFVRARAFRIGQIFPIE